MEEDKLRVLESDHDAVKEKLLAAVDEDNDILTTSYPINSYRVLAENWSTQEPLPARRPLAGGGAMPQPGTGLPAFPMHA